MRLRLEPATRMAAALALILAVGQGGQAGEPVQTAEIDQVGRQTVTAERSSAALDQIPASPARTEMDQIDPAARSGPGRDEPGLEPAMSARGSSGAGCDVSAAQAAIIETLRAQGRILADDCDLVEWVAISQDRTTRDERRARAEAATATLPERLTFTSERERAEADRLQRLEAGRAGLTGARLPSTGN
ncbi:MAG: hypothetical protein ACK46Q_09390 [Hyphomonas sp.]